MLRGLAARARRLAVGLWRRSEQAGFRPGRFLPRRSVELVLAPQDLRTADPVAAADMLAGRFAFAGKALAGGGRPPFALQPPSSEWAAELHGFGWLRHLRAGNTLVSRLSARNLVDAWLQAPSRGAAPATDPAVAARRVLSFLAQSPLLLEEADIAFYRRFLRALLRDLGRLRRARPKTGGDRLLVAIALAAAAMSLETRGRMDLRAVRRLERELDRQFLPDGGHASRNAGVLIEALADLLPLRQAFVARSVAVPAAMGRVVDRGMAMLRFFRHGDGAFALFNGMGATPGGLVATLLASDDTHAPPPREAGASGYQRLEAGPTVCLFDVGAAPPPAFAEAAHAGALAFELSDGVQRLVVNAGTPASARSGWEDLARGTAAHSTLTIDGRPSAAFRKGILRGPPHVTAERREAPEGAGVVASHDGYAARHRLVHRRTLALAADGAALVGEDALLPSGTRRPVDGETALRFHLHPNVRVRALADAGALELVVPGGRRWRFDVDGGTLAVEDAVYLGNRGGAVRTDQIVVRARAVGTPTLRWRFERL